MGYAPLGVESFIGKGTVLFDRFVSGVSNGHRHLGACTAVSLEAANIERKKLNDPTQALAPVLNDVVTKLELGIKIAMRSMNKDNLAIWGMGVTGSTAQTAATATDESHVVPALDRFIQLNKNHASSITTVKVGAVTKTAGTDYIVTAEWLQRGLIFIPAGSTIAPADTILVTYPYTSFTKDVVKLATAQTVEGALHFYSDPTTGEDWDVKIWHASLAPEGSVDLISEDYVTLSLSGSVIADVTRATAAGYADAPNGIVERLSA